VRGSVRLDGCAPADHLLPEICTPEKIEESRKTCVFEVYLVVGSVFLWADTHPAVKRGRFSAMEHSKRCRVNPGTPLIALCDVRLLMGELVSIRDAQTYEQSLC
jgi:hypothetical protein